MDRILLQRQDGTKIYDVNSTPTLIVNGQKVNRAPTFEYLEKVFKEIVPDS